MRTGSEHLRKTAIQRAPGGKSASEKKTPIDSVAFHADAELIASSIHFAVRDYQIEELFALHLAAGRYQQSM